MEKSFKQYFLTHGTKMKIEKGVYLYQTFGNQAVYMLDEGICALTSITKSGIEKIYLYFHPVRIVGFNPFVVEDQASLSGHPDFSIVTKTSCVMYRMPVTVFQELLQTCPDFNLSVLHILAENYDDALTHFHRMLDESAICRLIHLLLDVSRDTGSSLLIPGLFTHAELAKYLGTHTVTVSRIMTQLKKQGYLKKTPKGLMIVDPKALERLMESDALFKY